MTRLSFNAQYPCRGRTSGRPIPRFFTPAPKKVCGFAAHQIIRRKIPRRIPFLGMVRLILSQCRPTWDGPMWSSALTAEFWFCVFRKRLQIGGTGRHGVRPLRRDFWFLRFPEGKYVSEERAAKRGGPYGVNFGRGGMIGTLNLNTKTCRRGRSLDWPVPRLPPHFCKPRRGRLSWRPEWGDVNCAFIYAEIFLL